MTEAEDLKALREEVAELRKELKLVRGAVFPLERQHPPMPSLADLAKMTPTIDYERLRRVLGDPTKSFSGGYGFAPIIGDGGTEV